MNPVLFLIIILLVIAGGYILYKKQEAAPTDAPSADEVLGPCGSGTPLEYDQEGNVTKCECKEGTAGSNCEYTRNNYCNNGGYPVNNADTGVVSCVCDEGKEGNYCCRYDDPVYDKRNKCSDNIECTPKGWKIKQKSCNELTSIYKTNPECTNVCGVGNKNNLRCNSYNYDLNAVVSCANSSPYISDNSDAFLQALYYPPDELQDPLDPNKNWNSMFWEVLKTDRDLSSLIRINNDVDRQAARTQGNYGAFFKVYTFPDTYNGIPPTTITNADLKNAIDGMFNNQPIFSFDNFGNISIYVNGSTKSFHNPVFPYKKTKLTEMKDGTEVNVKDLQKCTEKRYGIDSSGDGLCWQYLQNTQMGSYSELGTSNSLLQNNKNFITSTNKKWILYNNSKNEQQPLYKLLYNPMHGSNFNKYFSASDPDRRRNDILIQKYAEMAAEKGTYGLGPRNYGDDSAHCFGSAFSGTDGNINFPDCVGYNIKGGKKYFINPEKMNDNMQAVYNALKGACACGGPACDEKIQIVTNDLTNRDNLRDSFISKFKQDMANHELNVSANRGGQCPSEFKVNICQNSVIGVEGVNFKNVNFSADCK
jgi:hypothetical protein